MKILSLDQASVKTGYAIFDNEKIIFQGLIHIKEKDINLKLNQMIMEVIKVIDKYNPDILLFEDVSMQTNVKTLIVLSRLQGSIIGHCLNKNIPYIIYKPTTWRSILGFVQGRGIKRSELKQQAYDYIKTKYNINNMSEDTAEAMCIGSAYITELLNIKDNKE